MLPTHRYTSIVSCISYFFYFLLNVCLGQTTRYVNAHVEFSYVMRLIVWHICKTDKNSRRNKKKWNRKWIAVHADNFIVIRTLTYLRLFPWIWHIYWVWNRLDDIKQWQRIKILRNIWLWRFWFNVKFEKYQILLLTFFSSELEIKIMQSWYSFSRNVALLGYSD